MMAFNFSFNFWFIFAPIGALIAALVGYECSHSYGEYCDAQARKYAWIAKVVPIVAGVILCVLIYKESWLGLCQLFVSESNDALSDLIGLMLCLFTPILMSAAYARMLYGLASRCSQIGSSVLYCRATVQYERGQAKTVLDTSDLIEILLKAGWNPSSVREQHDVDEAEAEEAEEPETEMPKFLPSYPPSKTLVETEAFNPDGTKRKVLVPENQVLEFKLTMMHYCLTMARVQKLLRPLENEEAPVLEQPIEAAFVQQKQPEKSAFEALLEKLDEQDQKLMRAAVDKMPGLIDLIEAGDVTVNAEFIGGGADRRVRFSSMRRIQNTASA